MLSKDEVRAVLTRNGWDVRDAKFADEEWALHGERLLNTISVSVDVKGQPDGSAEVWGWFETDQLDLDLDEEVDDIGDLIYLLHYYNIVAKDKAKFSAKAPDR